ncbi:MAG: class I SAM-dependent methyltransferase [bacterium]
MGESELIKRTLEFMREEQKQGNQHVKNLQNKFSLRHYLRIAQEIKYSLPNKAKILDWGCGYGAMTFFLSKLGVNVIPSDVHYASSVFLSEMGIGNLIRIDSVDLPFKDESLEAVLSCGVLEHVAHPEESLDELNRVITKQGWLFIYMLPYKYGLYEFIASILKKSDHPVKYTFQSIKRILKKHGFEIIGFKRGNLFPKNLVFMPLFILKFIENLYNEHCDSCIFIEKILLRIPVLNLLSGTLEIKARKI